MSTAAIHILNCKPPRTDERLQMLADIHRADPGRVVVFMPLRINLWPGMKRAMELLEKDRDRHDPRHITYSLDYDQFPERR